MPCSELQLSRNMEDATTIEFLPKEYTLCCTVYKDNGGLWLTSSYANICTLSASFFPLVDVYTGCTLQCGPQTP